MSASTNFEPLRQPPKWSTTPLKIRRRIILQIIEDELADTEEEVLRHQRVRIGWPLKWAERTCILAFRIREWLPPLELTHTIVREEEKAAFVQCPGFEAEMWAWYAY